eukprot:TRINITY_DN11134_c0_g1_i1.p1 TRINITY_DN11134_c0_g1~~TRINITY_DN11134_c0_g1_i1.p1  ORF type:complete len:126 (-),score=49.90 TRINITY_DN11134_c0_g1_i1:60-389(-)
MVQRVTYRRRHAYNTASNKVKLVKTPGGRLSVHYTTKLAGAVKCADCQKALAGIPVLRPRKYHSISKTRKTVSRAYGGNRCGRCVRERIVRAFMIEEYKIVNRALKKRK